MKERWKEIQKGFRLFSLSLREFIDKHILFLLILVVTGLSLTVRYMSALFPTNDMCGYILNGWMADIEKVGFGNFYTVDSDYSPLYLFMIAVISLLPKGELVQINGYSFYQNWMYYLKSVYFLMDILIAVGMFLIALHVTKSKGKATIAYMVFLILPVQFTNSALWGNCDSMYFACFVYCLYFLLKRKDHLVWLFFGLALSLKMQAVFISPLLVYLTLSRRLKFYPIYMVAVVLLISFLPSYICGASFLEPFGYFSKQMNGYPNLTLGCANMWHLFGVSNMDSSSLGFNQASTYIGLLMIGVFMAILYLRKIRLTDENLIYVSIFLIGIVPFFLPHMHERYFYALDVLVVLYAIFNKKRFFLVFLMQVSSGIAYYHYMTGFSKYFIDVLGEDSVSIAALINLFVLALMFYDLMRLPHKTRKEDLDEIKKEKERISRVDILTDSLISEEDEKTEE